MMFADVDYSLYLVTDSTPSILGDRDLVKVVEAALKGGVTFVQYRDKVSDTGILLSTARCLHKITRAYNVPLLINDRVDVALAVGCEGVHIGQDDMDLKTARSLLGVNAIIGITVSTVGEALDACRSGADYLGIGTMFATATKRNTKDIIGTAGTKAILRAIAEEGKNVRTVSIGGINASTAQRVLYQSSDERKKLDGVAFVSAIMAARDPQQAAEELSRLVKAPPPFATSSSGHKCREVSDFMELVPFIIREVGARVPLTHNMTNLVVQNFAANVALAIGGSPIMANNGEEAKDLCKLGGALVINMGTVTADSLQNYVRALQAYNLEGRPVVFDPVGCGATNVRKSAVNTLLAAGYFDVIKGNEGEINVFCGSDVQQKGVDSRTSTTTEIEKAKMVRDLAARERNVIVMTGVVDIISDGTRTYAISNGHELLSKITGSGCVLGTIISLMLVVCEGDKLLGVLAGLLLYEIAAEIAADRKDVGGPGTFVPALIDEIYHLQKLTREGNNSWLKWAKVVEIKMDSSPGDDLAL